MDGCETNLAGDIFNCGYCGRDCSSDWMINVEYGCYRGKCRCLISKYGVVEQEKRKGHCVVHSAQPVDKPFQPLYAANLDCDNDDANWPNSNGCEVNPATDPNNCSGCGHACSTEHCTSGCTGGVCFIKSCDAGKDCWVGLPAVDNGQMEVLFCTHASSLEICCRLCRLRRESDEWLRGRPAH